MKTFKLMKLTIINQRNGNIVQNNIPLLNGLIINREDDTNRWIIEAYIEKANKVYFNQLLENKEEIMLQVKITKESNEPATFITSILSVNEIGENINVLFMGTIIERKEKNILKELTALLKEGYRGKELLKTFDEPIGKDSI
ncbi:YwpF family protein [Oceanobacillus chungangensis]|uniref:YwpF-like protein n=1 Tax=Oceanobacillus chungangensis TaxID=1229152 RepID=A0A3D8PRS5_9BACI|nr:YwpF family protein [Oceanobacillus chungangensis]RDW17991.1 hypothetical protein CWR45_11725 [Oceanobacillus chungangensis]